MSVWSVFWAAWALAGVIVETLAIRGSRQDLDTLSRNIQWLVRRPVVRWVAMAGWVTFSAWFVPHIWF